MVNNNLKYLTKMWNIFNIVNRYFVFFRMANAVLVIAKTVCLTFLDLCIIWAGPEMMVILLFVLG